MYLINNPPQGTLPSDNEINPRREGQEHYKVITLRSGKELYENVGVPTLKPHSVGEKDAKKEKNKNGE